MKFTNLTRQTEIGANSYYLEAGGRRIVLDCGMHPKHDGEEALPNMQPLAGVALDGIIISHAHLDHFGSLPVLMRRHPEASVFMNEQTAQIGDALLHNSVNVMLRQREESVAGPAPLFTHRETDRAAKHWRVCPMNQPLTLEGERCPREAAEDLTFELVHAGHVLGSTGVLLRAEGRTLFYTGDVNFDDQTVAKAATFPESGIDVLIIETTRGDHPLPAGFTRAAEEARFAAALGEAFDRGGCVLVPVFALGKTQELLAMFYRFRREKRLANVPLYIGGLSAKMTEIYDRNCCNVPRNFARLSLLEAAAPYVLNGRNIQDTPAKPGRIYALSSGMMTPKTLSNVFARRLVESPRDSIFFVGYADPVSPAGILKEAREGDQISLDPEEPPQTLRCKVEQFQFSAHAPRESLLAYIKKVAPPKVVLVHGDPAAIEWFRAQLAVELPQTEVVVPPPGQAIEL